MKAPKLRGILAIAWTAGCSMTTARPVSPDDHETKGIRIYDPMPLLVVTCTETQIVSAPDLSRGYAVQLTSVLATNQTDLKATPDGTFQEIDVKLDSTTVINKVLDLISTLGSAVAGKLPTLPLSATITGPIPGMLGVWAFDTTTDGRVVGLRQIARGADSCPTAQAGKTIVQPPVVQPKETVVQPGK
jgi:hypothetical protein